MAFEFINSTTIDPNARRRIRSHVMKGRNVGKTRQPRAKAEITKRSILQDTTLKSTRPLESPSSSGRSSSLRSEDEVPVTGLGEQIRNEISAWPTNELAMWPMPVELTPSSQRDIHAFLGIVSTALYPPEFCSPEDVTKSIWIQYLFLDEAYLHMTLALSVMYVNGFVVRQLDPTETAPHLARACRIVNQKLSGCDATSDLTIATVLSMSIYERLQGHYEIGLTHLRGLKSIVELRGGISQFAENAHLIQKIFRADIESALHYGSLPHFELNEIPGQEILSDFQNKLFQDHAYESACFPFLMEMSPCIQDVFLDILSVDHYFKAHITHLSKLKPEPFQAILIRISYKLISLSELKTGKPTENLENLLRLAMTAFMTTFWFQYGRKNQMFPFLYNRLRTTIESTIEDDSRPQELVLWSLLIGKGSLFTDAGDIWLVPRFAQLAIVLNLKSWEDTRHIIRRYPWVTILHERPGKDLWDTYSKQI